MQPYRAPQQIAGETSGLRYKLAAFPVADGLVFVLTPERLIEYQAAGGATRVILAAAAGGIGRFTAMSGGRKERVERKDILSGMLMNTASEPGGALWLTTTQGIARYAPWLWRTPVEVSGVDSLVHAILEDKKGRLWFACLESLVCRNGRRWSVYPLPAGESTNTYNTTALCLLPDGRLAANTMDISHMLTFDPERRTFAEVRHPENRPILLIAPRGDGTIWAEAREYSGPYRLDVYDGKSFQPYLDLGANWRIASLKYVGEGRQGELWLGGTGGPAACRNGRYQVLSTNPDYQANGAFSVHDTADGRVFAGGSGQPGGVRRQVLEADRARAGPGAKDRSDAGRIDLGGAGHGTAPLQKRQLDHALHRGRPAILVRTPAKCRRTAG